MSSLALEKLLKELATILQTSTEEYRNKIDVINPTIVSLSNESLKLSLSPIIEQIKNIKSINTINIQAKVIEQFKAGFLSGNVKRETYSDQVPSETLATYYTNLELFYVYKEGSLNAYQSVQRRIVKGTEYINKYFNSSEVTDVLFSQYSYYDKSQNKTITASRSNIETGHLYSDKYSTTPAVEKLTQVSTKIDSIITESTNRDSSQVPKLNSINNFIASINALKNITLTSMNDLIKVHKRDIKVIFKGDSELKIDYLGKLSASKDVKIVILIPEARASNNAKSIREKKAISNIYKTAIGSYLKRVDVASLKSSKSIKEAVQDHLVETLLEGRGRGYSSKAQASHTEVLEATTKVKSNKKVKANVSLKIKAPKAKTAPVRNISGQFTSIPKILAMLQGQINSQVALNMNTPRLRYRSGRFADSVKINNVSRSDKGLWTITYGYMTYPYQTFEPGYKQGSRERDPRSLITTSIRQIVSKEIGNKFRAVRIGGAGSRGRVR